MKKPFRYRHGWIKIGTPDKVADYKASGGFSRDKSGAKPTGGFMVSRNGTEAVYDVSVFNQDPEGFIAEHATKHANELEKPGNYQGSWTDNGKVYLDISTNPQDTVEAARLAQENKQIAVGDVAKINAGDWGNAFPTTEVMTSRAKAIGERRRLATERLLSTKSGVSSDLSPEKLHIELAKATVAYQAMPNGPEKKAAGLRWDALSLQYRRAKEFRAERAFKTGKVVNMSTSIMTPMTTPSDTDIRLSKSGRVAFWKQILPKKSVDYTAKDGSRQTLNFDEKYLTDLAAATAVDKVGFLLADVNNSHTMDPERWRGEVVKMQVRDDGLYGKIVFPSEEAAKAVMDNPSLGVSARIREGVQRSDGSTVPRGIIHVLGTLDPQISGMADWQTADLSQSGDSVLDLTHEKYEEPVMADKKKTDEAKPLADYTEAEINAMTEEELDDFLTEFVPEISSIVDSDEDDSDEDDSDDEDGDRDAARTLVKTGADMSKDHSQDIELANSRAAYATTRADEALRRLAAAEWESAESKYLAAGVPPHLLELAKPVLNRPDDMVIDLSNSDEDDVNVSAVVRGLLDAAKGTIDLSNEEGHLGTFHKGDGEDPDAEMLATWDSQS